MSFFSRILKKRESNTSGTPGAGVSTSAWLETATEMTGFFAAHAVWCVSEGETLIPFAGFETHVQGRSLLRFASERIEEGVAAGKARLANNSGAAARAVLIFDGFIPLESGKTDALILAVRDFTQGDAGMTWAIPYRPAGASSGFAVHRPKMLPKTELDPSTCEGLGRALWKGIAQHEKGAAVWNANLDESR